MPKTRAVRTSIAALAGVAAMTAGPAGPAAACACSDPFTVTATGVAPALDVICAAGFAGRADQRLRRRAGKVGFDYWGDHWERAGDDGVIEVTTTREACSIEIDVDPGQARAVTGAFDQWAARRPGRPARLTVEAEPIRPRLRTRITATLRAG